MLRSHVLVFAAVVGVSGGLTAPATAADPVIKFGETLEGELTEMKGIPNWPGFVDTFSGYAMEVSVSLKAGQDYTFTATVVGKDRKVSVGLVDPSGKIVVATKRNTETKTVTLKAEEVSATGKYRVVIVSDRIGNFSLLASGPTAEPTIKELEEKLQRLKKEIAETEAKLEALKKKP